MRVLGDGSHHDPFVLFDDYIVPSDASFPLHSHSGFEGFQYLFEGSTLFEDRKGISGAIGPGGARRFVCTGDFEHSERPLGGIDAKGVLLWVKLPAGLRSMPQLYRQSDAGSLPLREEGGLSVRTVVGKGSPLGSVLPLTMEIVEGAGRFRTEFGPRENGLLYVRSGSVRFDGRGSVAGQGYAIDGPCSLDLEASVPTVMVIARGERTMEAIVQSGGHIL